MLPLRLFDFGKLRLTPCRLYLTYELLGSDDLA
jgi:hypothetical protein